MTQHTQAERASSKPQEITIASPVLSTCLRCATIPSTLASARSSSSRSQELVGSIAAPAHVRSLSAAASPRPLMPPPVIVEVTSINLNAQLS